MLMLDAFLSFIEKNGVRILTINPMKLPSKINEWINSIIKFTFKIR